MSTRAVLIAFALLFAASVGCASRDFENICYAEQRADLGDLKDPSERAMRTAQWIDKKLWSRDARQVFEALAGVPCEDKGRLLVEAAREAGYKGPCPLAVESGHVCAEGAAQRQKLRMAPAPSPR